ncbi:RagB/SusD family nutrient uptake outer membrane protein [Mucilaginibacter ginsenosidivorax]|uniref:RagB/SusD family nutrient uptake outer membrane protein n=1 Tax=Mucilaginibacter ginsenosidivorax TaxID=862126 RepID=A0A5B8W561_9SPHI|nr:RagB/SusD family nutrient uptake outer membrane protein [Mucilaginibacter ginsenosidivorax]QEC78567.1 RagB/SusD family nutrient uptake outer membrane protein [Mucilaginibacter ginsenosidivorax]
MKNIKIYYILFLFSLTMGCKKDFLDVVPDNVATIDNSFTSRNEAEKYLFTCYSYLPQESDINSNPAFLAGDEFWTYWPIVSGNPLPSTPQQIARGNQNVSSPYLNFWDGTNGGKPLWKAIRDCNIFLDNVGKVPDLDPSLKDRWTAEVKFLKAYYHFYLLRMYGPIPIVDKNLPISASPEEVRVLREPVDKVVDYIVSLLDSASAKLPLIIQNRSSELGRITKPAALSIKARVLVTAASPLFNGNTDFGQLKNHDGTALFNSNNDPAKWERASKACKEAIESCEAAGIALYQFNGLLNLSPRLKQEMTIRNSIAEKWSNELIWGFSNGGGSFIQGWAIPRLDPSKLQNDAIKGELAPTIGMAELFYTDKGVPINEDKTWDFANRNNLRTATSADQDYLQNGYTTVGLHFNREPRFYADMAFDGSIWFMQNGTWKIQAKLGQNQSRKGANGYSTTGYFTKKLVNWNFVILPDYGFTQEIYAWPMIRLADVYLMYAEALNEQSGPSPEAYNYINLVRSRAGLPTVQESWTNYSTNPGKFLTKDGFRDIVQQERSIEFAFEGHNFWDLRRWKKAPAALNSAVYGWDIEQANASTYYRRKLLFNQKFVAPRDNFWPISEGNLIINRNLVQNIGW